MTALLIENGRLVDPSQSFDEAARLLLAERQVAEINPNPTGLSAGFDHAIAGKAGTVLPQLVERMS